MYEAEGRVQAVEFTSAQRALAATEGSKIQPILEKKIYSLYLRASNVYFC